MSVRLVSSFIAVAALFVSQGAFAQTRTPRGATPTPSPSPSPTPEVFATPEETPEVTPEPTPEPMPTPEPIPEEGPNAGKPTSAVVHGFVIGRFDSTDGKGPLRTSGSGFSVQNARLIIAGDVHENVDYLMAIEPLLQTGPLQEAWVRWKPVGKIGPSNRWRLQAGQFRKPLGYEGRISEAALETMEYSMTTQFLMGPSNYDIGIGFGATLAERVELDMAIVNGTGPFDVNTATPTVLGAQDPLEHKDVMGRAGLDLMEGRLQTGVSIAGGHASDPLYGIPSASPGLPPTIIPIFYWRAAYDAVANVGPFFVASEGVYGKSTFKAPPDPLGGPTPGGPTATGASMYVMFGYRVGNFLPNFRVEYIDPSIGEDKASTAKIENAEGPRDWANAVALGVNWTPVKRTKVRVQYELVSGNAPQTVASPVNAYLPANARPGYGKDMSGTFSASIQADF